MDNHISIHDIHRVFMERYQSATIEGFFENTGLTMDCMEFVAEGLRESFPDMLEGNDGDIIGALFDHACNAFMFGWLCAQQFTTPTRLDTLQPDDMVD